VGVAPSASPQLTRRTGKLNRHPALWWALAVLIVAVIVLIIVWV
jgi:hypothetical protein